MKKRICEATLEEIFSDVEAFEGEGVLISFTDKGRIFVDTVTGADDPGFGNSIREALIDFHIKFLISIDWNKKALDHFILNWIELKGDSDEH